MLSVCNRKELKRSHNMCDDGGKKKWISTTRAGGGGEETATTIIIIKLRVCNIFCSIIFLITKQLKFHIFTFVCILMYIIIKHCVRVFFLF